MSLPDITNCSVQEKRQLFLILVNDPAILPFMDEYVYSRIAELLPNVTERLDKIEAEVQKRKNGGKL